MDQQKMVEDPIPKSLEDFFLFKDYNSNQKIK
jgi:hypothetical protein